MPARRNRIAVVNGHLSMMNVLVAGVVLVMMAALCVVQFAVVAVFGFSLERMVEPREGEFVFEVPHVNKHSLSFRIEANGGRAHGSLAGYCKRGHCALPLVFGGPQVLSVFHKTRIIARYTIEAGQNRFYCINGGWERRICRFRDICFDGTNLTFVSPYPIEINTSVPFLVLGGRPPPYDKKADRIRMINVNVSKQTIPNGRIIHEETTFYASPYHNSHMLWHLLFDFVLPLFHTTTIFNISSESPVSVIMPKSSPSVRKEVLKSFASSVGRLILNHCYRDLIVGISKVRDVETGTLYEFPPNITKELLPRLFEYLNITFDLPTRPEIVFVGRRTSKRVIVNFEEVTNAIIEAFPGYRVRPLYLEDMQMRDQIEAAYKSTLFIGVHGSGLSHLAWMRPDAALIEVAPYNFTCCDWYKRATAVSGVQYFRYSPAFPNGTVSPTAKQIECWSATPACQPDCVDPLKDQNIVLDVPHFTQFLKSTLSII